MSGDARPILDWAYAWQVLPVLLGALKVTVQATAAGYTLALVLGMVWTLLRRSRRLWISAPAAAVVEFVRSTPLLIQLYFLFYVFPEIGVHIRPLTCGILGLGLHYSSYLAEVYRSGIEGVPVGQWEAATALNFSPLRVWTGIILPQAIPPMYPALGNYLIGMFKETA